MRSDGSRFDKGCIKKHRLHRLHMRVHSRVQEQFSQRFQNNKLNYTLRHIVLDVAWIYTGITRSKLQRVWSWNSTLTRLSTFGMIKATAPQQHTDMRCVKLEHRAEGGNAELSVIYRSSLRLTCT